MKLSQKIYLVLAHPAMHKSRINTALINAISDLDGVTVRDLYAKYPDHHINVRKEQNFLVQHDIIIWQHPFYWYSCPALLKEWIDLVFEHGWAYGHDGHQLAGKKVLSCISTGGSQDAYSKEGRNGYPIHNYLLPFRQTARLCKMSYLPPFVVHGTHMLDDASIDTYAKKFRNLLIALRDGLVDIDTLKTINYANQIVE